MPTRLLITTSTFPLSPHDSLPRFVLDLAEGLQRECGEVTVLVPDDAEADPADTWGRVALVRHTYAFPRRIQRLCYRHGMIANIRTRPWLALFIPGYLLSQCVAIFRLCTQKKIDIVNSHWILFQGLCGAIAGLFVRFHHVVHIHAAGLFTLRRLPRAAGRLLARVIHSRSDYVICESSYIRGLYDELLGYPSGAGISCMGVNVAGFARARNPQHTGPQVLFVGRLVEKKGITYLLKAFPLVRRRVPDARLDIIGHGVLLEQLTKTVERNPRIGEGVRLLGGMPHSRVIDQMSQARVIAIPSVLDAHGEMEGMPTVVLEAMAAGKHLVASNVDGVPDLVVHGRNGWLCRPKDPADLAAALVAALEYQSDDVRTCAIQTAEEYDWPVLCRRYAALLLGTMQ